MKSGTKWMWALVGAVAGVVALPMTVQADYPNHGLYLGVYGGYMLKIGDWDLDTRKRNSMHLSSPSRRRCWERDWVSISCRGLSVKWAEHSFR